MGTEGPCPIGPFRNCERSQRNCERSQRDCERSQNGLLPGIAERSAAACFEDSEDESISDSRSSEITTAAVRSGVPNKVFGSEDFLGGAVAPAYHTVVYAGSAIAYVN
jgi:hypothetical protein